MLKRMTSKRFEALKESLERIKTSEDDDLKKLRSSFGFNAMLEMIDEIEYLRSDVARLQVEAKSLKGVASRPSVEIRFGKRITQLRQAAGLSQEKLAELGSISRDYMSEVERGLRNISLEKMYSLSQGLNISMKELLKGL